MFGEDCHRDEDYLCIDQVKACCKSRTSETPRDHSAPLLPAKPRKYQLDRRETQAIANEGRMIKE